jgi:hypothetical protein
MRRLARTLNAIGDPAGLVVLARLVDGDATQKELRDAVKDAGVEISTGGMSVLMTRLQDLGLARHLGRDTGYGLIYPDETQRAFLHVANLGLRISSDEQAQSVELHDLARRAGLKLTEPPADAASD